MKTTRLLGLLICLIIGNASLSWAQYVPKEEREKRSKADSSKTTTPEKKPTVQPREDPKPRKERASSLSGQSFSDRLVFGGNTWLQLGTFTRVDLFPTVGYRLTEKLIAGVGINYQYLSTRYDITNSQGQRSSVRVSEHYYGWRVFAQQFVVPPVFAWAELESTNGNFYDFDTQAFSRRWLYNPMVGLGYQQGNSDRLGTGFYFMVLYNLNYVESISQYSSPWVTRVGFTF